MKIKPTLYIVLIISVVPTFAQAQQAATDILGFWYNEEKTAKIEVTKSGNEYQGKIIWINQDEVETDKDENNPNPALKNRSLVGLKLLEGFVYDDGEYVDGEIYDPKNGKTYSCYMKLETKNKLFVRGYIGFSLIGRTTYWTRTSAK